MQTILIIGYVAPDIISGSYESFVDWVRWLNPATYSFIIKACLILLTPTAFAKAAIAQGNTSSVGQSMAVLIGILLAAAWPVPDLDHSPQVKAWLVAISILVIISIPAILPKDVINGLHIQRKAMWILYGIFLLLFLLQVFGRRC